MLFGGEHGQYRAVRGGVMTHPAEDAFAIFQQDLEVVTLISEQRRWIQLPHSTIERLTNSG
jgi:hypothetical protein